ncbi:MAG: zinc ribbon domain-containing protein [Anaerolineae bacterium]|nr:zinc ribbon domain-containing protein [Anaerolineae bacterium]
MPIYLYECEDCGERFEAKQSFSEAPLKICPTCEGTIHRVIQPVGVVFKGSGFYVTDSRGKQNLATSGTRKDDAKPAEGGSDTSSTASSTDTSAAKPEKAEAKPASTTASESK